MKRLMFIAFLLTTVQVVLAQGPPPPGVDDEKMETLRIAFLTRYLDLTTDEAQKFWPVYNQMRGELKIVMDKEMDLRKGKSLNDMNDEELTKLINAHFENEQAILNIKKKYADEFKNVLPLRKVALLADAENEFKREVLKNFRDKQGPPGGGGGGGRPGGGPDFKP